MQLWSIKFGLFGAQSLHGIDRSGAAGGDVAGNECNEGEERRHQREGECIVRLNAVEETGGHFGEHPCGGPAEDECDESEHHALAQDKALDSSGLRAQGHANANFPCAAAD